MVEEIRKWAVHDKLVYHFIERVSVIQQILFQVIEAYVLVVSKVRFYSSMVAE